MIDDLVTILATGFLIVIAFLVILIATATLGGVLEGLPLSAADNATASGVFERFPAAFDNAASMAIVAMMLGSLILLYYVSVTPALFFVIVIVVGLVTLVAGALANAWAVVRAEPLLSAAVVEIPKLDFLMQHYPMVILLYAILAMIVFFAKPNELGGAA